ncbi:MAG: acyltransferase family protein [Rubripirellula sp.]|nr:acyltransferase family protein [Rubripirellula sp.]
MRGSGLPSAGKDLLEATIMDVLPIRTGSQPATKFAGLDGLRAISALGVVLLHACVPYARHPMPGLAWPVRDGSSGLVDLAFWSIELFIMPVFLVIAGFFTYRGLQHRGEKTLIRQRARRLLIPLLFGVVVILPIDLHLWVLGWVIEGRVDPVKLQSFKFDGQIDKNLWGLSHLWFLQYVFLYICVLALASFLGKRFQRLRLPAWSLFRWTLVLIALGTAVLAIRPNVVWGFQHSFWPVPSKWLYSGLFFALGTLIAKHDPQFQRLSAAAIRLWPPALGISLAALLLGRWHLNGGENQVASFLLAALTCISATLLTTAMIGTVATRVKQVPPVVEYLAAASFWVYIVHHPIVGLIHIDLYLLAPQWSPLVKAGVSFGLATGVSLLTYEGLVRTTTMGRWLGFAWQQKPEPKIPLPTSKPVESVKRRPAKAA